MPWNSAERRRNIRTSATVAIFVFLTVFPAAQTTAPTAQSPTSNAPVQGTATAQSPASRAPFIMIDAAHGGSESGAVLGPSILEKDVTLAYSRRLRQELLARGLQAQVIRDGDFALSLDERASSANIARPALYICVHAASLGAGIRVYTAMLPDTAENSGPFVNWSTAQQGSLARSRTFQQQLASTIQKMGFPVRALIAPLRTLNSVAAPAIAIEIAPANGNVGQLASADYQAMTAAAVASAISGLRSKLETAP